MNQCLRISFHMEIPENFLHEVILKHARVLGVEGTVQAVAPQHIRITVCGAKESVDKFLDVLHKAILEKAEGLEIEPFLKDKDYRGVFRVIE